MFNKLVKHFWGQYVRAEWVPCASLLVCMFHFINRKSFSITISYIFSWDQAPWIFKGTSLWESAINACRQTAPPVPARSALTHYDRGVGGGLCVDMWTYGAVWDLSTSFFFFSLWWWWVDWVCTFKSLYVQLFHRTFHLSDGGGRDLTYSLYIRSHVFPTAAEHG